MNSAVEVLKKARMVFGNVITEDFLKKYIDDGLISKEESELILRG